MAISSPAFSDASAISIADGTGFVVPAYRGYAGSSGAPSEEGLLRDAAAAYAFTTARYDTDRIVAWGFSLGTGSSGRAGCGAENRKTDPGGALQLDCRRRGISLSDFSGPGFCCGILSARTCASGRVHVPLLVMHGANDPAIPIVFGERLFALANEPKQFIRFPDGGHIDLDQFGGMTAARQFIGAPGG